LVGTRACFAERVDGEMTLRRGFVLGPNLSVLVVEDVVTTGRSTLETVDAIRFCGADPVGVACIANRSGKNSIGNLPLVPWSRSTSRPSKPTPARVDGRPSVIRRRYPARLPIQAVEVVDRNVERRSHQSGQSGFPAPTASNDRNSLHLALCPADWYLVDQLRSAAILDDRRGHRPFQPLVVPRLQFSASHTNVSSSPLGGQGAYRGTRQGAVQTRGFRKAPSTPTARLHEQRE